MTDEPWPNRPWLAVTPTVAPSTWRPVAWPLSCQVSSQTWAMAWAGMASPKQASPPDGLTGIRPPMRRRAAAQQLLGLTLRAQPEVLVPVEFQRGGQVVDLGQAQVLGPDAGLGVGGVEDLVLEHPIRRRHHCGGIRCDIRQFGQMLRVARRHRGHRAHRRHALERAEMLLGERGLLATINAAAPSDVAQMSSSRSGSATTGLAKHVLDRGLLAEAGVRVLQAVLGVLDLHRREVLERGAVEIHPPARQQREVHRVGRADQMEALPVRVVLSFAADRGEEPLRRGVGADDQRDVAESGQDLRAGALQRLGSAGARRIRRRHRHAVPAQLLRERRARDESGIAVADGVGAGDQLDLAPVQPRLRQARRAPRRRRIR